MKNSAIQKAVGLACVLSICFMANYVMAVENPPESNVDYLTVRQSLIPMFGIAYNEKEFPFNRINPKAKEYLRFYLEKDNTDRNHICGAIWLLGFIGDEDDILFIEKYIDKAIMSSRNLEHRVGNLQNIALFAGYFAGMMLKRDIEGADSFLKKYATVSSWMVPGEEETPENLSDARSSYSYFIMGTYQYSKSSYIYPLLQEKLPGPRFYIHEKAIDSLNKIQVDKYTELMKQKTLPQEKLNKNFAKCFERNGEWIDMLLRKQTYAQWYEAYKKQRTVPKAAKKSVDSFESIDMSETTEGEYLKAIASDSAKAYMQISRMLLDGDANDLPIKKEILQDIQNTGLNSYDGFQIMVDIEAQIIDFVPAIKSSGGKDEGSTAEPVVVKDKVTAEVTFDIQGDVIVNMKRIDDKWYWNPALDVNVSSVSDIVEDNYLINSASEAMIAYTQITGMIIDGSYDPLVIPVLDNGKLIPLEKRKKDKNKMAEALDLEKRILEDLTKADLNNYGGYHLKVKFEATLGDCDSVVNGNKSNGGTSLETGAMPLAVKGFETADMTFMIRDAAETYKKYAPKKSGYDSFSGAGNLRVHMKRINGKWYWCPFGW